MPLTLYCLLRLLTIAVIIAVILPTYIFLLWMLETRKQLKYVDAYRILLHIGVLDCLKLLGLLYSVLTNFLNFDSVFLNRILGLFVCLYYCSLALFFLLLAVNRFLSLICHVTVKPIVFSICTYVIWIATMGILPLAIYIDDPSHVPAFLKDKKFYGDGDSRIAKMTSPIDMGVYSAVLLLYCGIAVLVLRKRLEYGRNISMVEGRILLQGFLLFVPNFILESVYYFYTEFDKCECVMWHIFLTFCNLTPVMNLAVQLGCNVTIRNVFFRSFRFCNYRRKLFVVTGERQLGIPKIQIQAAKNAL